MKVCLEDLPQLLWGQRWSSLLPARLLLALERPACDWMYSCSPPLHIRLRPGRSAATLVFAGDLALHRWPAKESPERVFQAAQRVFRDADLAVVNLETLLTTHDVPAGRLGRFLKAAPATVACLQYLGVNAVMSANNHALDFGTAGLAQCGDTLQRAKIAWFGIRSGRNDRLPGALIRSVNGVNIGMIGATDHFAGVTAQRDLSPVWSEPALLRQYVRTLRPQCQVVVVQLHWGYERVMYPTRWHRDLARQLVDDGADIVCCHHAHVAMGIETWGRGVIAHGLGNFYFGSRRHRHPLQQFAILLRASVDRAGLLSADVVPVRTDSSGVVRVEREACPGFDRLCRRLTDDAFLDTVERARVDYELAQIAACIEADIASKDSANLMERRAHLDAPRQEWLLTKAGQSPTWLRFGKWLRDFRALPAEAIQGFKIPPLPQIRDLHRLLEMRLLTGRLP